MKLIIRLTEFNEGIIFLEHKTIDAEDPNTTISPWAMGEHHTISQIMIAFVIFLESDLEIKIWWFFYENTKGKKLRLIHIFRRNNWIQLWRHNWRKSQWFSGHRKDWIFCLQLPGIFKSILKKIFGCIKNRLPHCHHPNASSHHRFSSLWSANIISHKGNRTYIHQSNPISSFCCHHLFSAQDWFSSEKTIIKIRDFYQRKQGYVRNTVFLAVAPLILKVPSFLWQKSSAKTSKNRDLL